MTLSTWLVPAAIVASVGADHRGAQLSAEATSIRLKIAASAVAVLAASGVIAAASVATSGNAAAIAFERAVTSAENHAVGYLWNESGYIRMKSAVSGNKVSLALAWGAGAIKPGWTATDAQGTLALHDDGRVSWLLVQLERLPPCTAGSACKANPMVDIVIDSAGTFIKAGLSSAFNQCVVPYTAALPWTTGLPKTGGQWFSVHGDFQGPPRRDGADTLVTYTYPLGATQLARETDMIDTRAKAIKRATIKVTAGSRTSTFTDNYSQLTRLPFSAPPTTVCK